MKLVVPSSEQYLDEIIEHCWKEFGDPAETIEYWEEFMPILTYPSFEETGLLLLDGDKLAGFALHTSFENYAVAIGTDTMYMETGLHFLTGRAAAEGMGLPWSMEWQLRESSASHVGHRDFKFEVKGYPNSIREMCPEDAYLSELVVAEEYRGQGLGTGIIAGLCAMLESQGVKRLFSHASSPASERAHEKAGLKRIAYISPFYWDGGGTTFMGCTLGDENDE